MSNELTVRELEIKLDKVNQDIYDLNIEADKLRKRISNIYGKGSITGLKGVE